MNCNVARSEFHGSIARGFYTLFFRWSRLSSFTAPGTRYLHRSCATRRLDSRSSRTPGCPKRQYCSTWRQNEVDDAMANVPPPKEPPLSSHLRRLMRTMPHSVVVATSTSPACDRRATPIFRGMTISSFTTLTLAPSPIITFNIRQPSQTLAAIAKSKQFMIHILSATESGARVADAFTRGNRIGSDLFLNPAFSVLRQRNGGESGGLDPPLLAAEGIIKVLRCELLEDRGLVEVGDHVLVLGKVLSIIESSTEHEAQGVEQGGLCYLDRAYRHVGSVIELPDEKINDAGR